MTTPVATPPHAHPVPAKVLVAVFAALLLLTLTTVRVAAYDLGEWNIVLALAIAVCKASLVLLYFMHLRYDRLFNGLILIVALLFVVLFISLALTDTQAYQHELRAYNQTQSP
jgi:cytochrome c oxidase subunit 4